MSRYKSDEPLCDEGSSFSDADLLTGAVAQFVVLADTEDFADPVDERRVATAHKVCLL
jgi:hypothetical protein